MAEYAPAGSATDRYCVMGGVASAVFLLISNMWVAPLQFALMICWLVYRRFTGKCDSIPFLITAWAFPYILIYPFFSEFADQTLFYNVKIEWVQVRPPLANWLLVMGPAVLLWIVCLTRIRFQPPRALFSGVTGKTSRLRGKLETLPQTPMAAFIIIVGAGALIGTYVFYVHDLYGGEFAVFNTTLKWWPWAYALMTCLGIAVCWVGVTRRVFTIGIIMLMLAGNLWITGRSWYARIQDPKTKEHIGRMDGYAWFIDVPEQRGIYEVMKNLPQGVALESVPLNPSGPCITIAQFTGHYSMGGWIGHEMLWRGERIDLARLQDNRDAFYRGELKDPLSWLATATSGGIDYVIWMDRDNARAPNNWNNINEAIKSRYDWKLVNQIGETYWGVWIRRTHP